MITALVGDRVLVAPISQKEHVTESGILALDQDAPDVMGRVVVCPQSNADVKVDDVVLFSPFAGQRLDYEGEKYLMLRAEEILGVWE